MKYLGSKRRIAQEILEIILKDRGDRPYVEPFCGGCNSLINVNGVRYANDINSYVIAMFKESVAGRIFPDVITEEQYKHIKNNKDEDPALTGFVGIACSFMGKWFCTYARNDSKNRDMVQPFSRRASTNLQRETPFVMDIIFTSVPYDQMNIPPNSVIYCDPPYSDTIQYGYEFYDDQFYNWCRDMKKQGHTIFISEYDMPEDFKCVWQKEFAFSGNNTQKKHSIRTEKLFTL